MKVDKKVIVVGSLNMDLSITSPYMPKQGETVIGSGFIVSPGGKGANQAIAAARIGGNVSMIGCVGADDFGNQLSQNLNKNGVTTDYIESIFDVSTGVAVIIVSDHDNRIVLDSGANYEITTEKVRNVIDKIANTGDILLVQLEIPIEVAEATIIAGKEKGMVTILNPAPASILKENIYAYLDYLIPNENECELLCGINPIDENTRKEAIQLFLNKGVHNVMITLGEKGVVYSCGKEIKYEQGIKVKAVDTTAAGDSLAGAFAACLSKNMDFEEAVLFSNNVAALTVTKKGAQDSLPYYKDVVDFIDKRLLH